MKIEMNIRPSFGRHGCRIVVAVTGKRGHRVYASRDDVVEEPRMSQFRATGVVAPDHCQPVPHRVHRRLYTPVTGQRRSEEIRFRDRARIRESPARHCFHHSTLVQTSVETSQKMKMKCACGTKRNDNSKDKRQLAATDVENKKA